MKKNNSALKAALQRADHLDVTNFFDGIVTTKNAELEEFFQRNGEENGSFFFATTNLDIVGRFLQNKIKEFNQKLALLKMCPNHSYADFERIEAEYEKICSFASKLDHFKEIIVTDEAKKRRKEKIKKEIARIEESFGENAWLHVDDYDVKFKKALSDSFYRNDNFNCYREVEEEFEEKYPEAFPFLGASSGLRDPKGLPFRRPAFKDSCEKVRKVRREEALEIAETNAHNEAHFKSVEEYIKTERKNVEDRVAEKERELQAKVDEVDLLERDEVERTKRTDSYGDEERYNLIKGAHRMDVLTDEKIRAAGRTVPERGLKKDALNEWINRRGGTKKKTIKYLELGLGLVESLRVYVWGKIEPKDVEVWKVVDEDSGRMEKEVRHVEAQDEPFTMLSLSTFAEDTRFGKGTGSYLKKVFSGRVEAGRFRKWCIEIGLIKKWGEKYRSPMLAGDSFSRVYLIEKRAFDEFREECKKWEEKEGVKLVSEIEKRRNGRKRKAKEYFEEMRREREEALEREAEELRKKLGLSVEAFVAEREENTRKVLEKWEKRRGGWNVGSSFRSRMPVNVDKLKIEEWLAGNFRWAPEMKELRRNTNAVNRFMEKKLGKNEGIEDFFLRSNLNVEIGRVEYDALGGLNCDTIMLKKIGLRTTAGADVFSKEMYQKRVEKMAKGDEVVSFDVKSSVPALNYVMNGGSVEKWGEHDFYLDIIDVWKEKLKAVYSGGDSLTKEVALDLIKTHEWNLRDIVKGEVLPIYFGKDDNGGAFFHRLYVEEKKRLGRAMSEEEYAKFSSFREGVVPVYNALRESIFKVCGPSRKSEIFALESFLYTKLTLKMFEMGMEVVQKYDEWWVLNGGGWTNPREKLLEWGREIIAKFVEEKRGKLGLVESGLSSSSSSVSVSVSLIQNEKFSSQESDFEGEAEKMVVMENNSSSVSSSLSSVQSEKSSSQESDFENEELEMGISSSLSSVQSEKSSSQEDDFSDETEKLKITKNDNSLNSHFVSPKTKIDSLKESYFEDGDKKECLVYYGVSFHGVTGQVTPEKETLKKEIYPILKQREWESKREEPVENIA